MGDSQVMNPAYQGVPYILNSLLIGFRKDDDEFLSTIAGNKIFGSLQALRQAGCHLPEAIIPMGMAVTVVEFLKVINVDKQNG